MNRSHLFSSLVLSISILAALLAALAWSGGRPTGEAASLRRLEEGVGALGEGLERAAVDLAALALKVDRLTEASALRPAGEKHGGAGSEERRGAEEGEAVKAILERLDDLAAKVEKASATQQPVLLQAGAVETAEERKRIVEENQPVALDHRRTPDERLQALRELRGRDGRSREVALAMLELIETPDLDPGTRADIIRNLDGVDFPELKDPLLRVLANDTHPETRAETVETLQPFYGDPAVHAAVAHVRDNDQDVRVRREALERLAQYEEERLEKAGGR